MSPVDREASPLLQQDRCGAVAMLTLNRPPKLNALNNELLEAIIGALDSVELDSAVRIVVKPIELPNPLLQPLDSTHIPATPFCKSVTALRRSRPCKSVTGGDICRLANPPPSLPARGMRSPFMARMSGTGGPTTLHQSDKFIHTDRRSA
jgi:hypothetical protein